MEVPVDKISEIGSLLALVVGMPPETNPAFMRVYLEALGVPKKIEVEDMGRLEEDSLKKISKAVLSLICVFADDKGIVKLHGNRKSKCEECALSPINMFFMKYGLKRMSGTVAIIHSIANNPDKVTVEKGAIKKFLDSTQKSTPERRGESLQQNEEIVNIRRSVRRQFTDPYIASEYSDLASVPDEMLPGWQSMPSTPGGGSHTSEKMGIINETLKERDRHCSATEEGLSFRFLTFISVKNHLLELDGATDGPFCHGKHAPGTMLSSTAKIIKQYADSDPEANQYQVMLLCVGSASQGM